MAQPVPERTKRARDHNRPQAACYLCGRPVTRWPAKHIHVIAGGALVADAGEREEPASDLGWWPIGPECARQHPTLHTERFPRPY